MLRYSLLQCVHVVKRVGLYKYFRYCNLNLNLSSVQDSPSSKQGVAAQTLLFHANENFRDVRGSEK